MGKINILKNYKDFFKIKKDKKKHFWTFIVLRKKTKKNLTFWHDPEDNKENLHQIGYYSCCGHVRQLKMSFQEIEKVILQSPSQKKYLF